MSTEPLISSEPPFSGDAPSDPTSSAMAATTLPSSNPVSAELTPDIQAQLDLLRDISMPAEISWWPLAPGWWALIALTLMMLLAGTIYLRRRRQSLRYLALQELTELRLRAAGLHPVVLGSELSVLLHRVAIAVDGQAAGMLSDHQWSHYLSEGEQSMDKRLAEFIASAPYQKPGASTLPDNASLLQGAEHWIRRHT